MNIKLFNRILIVTAVWQRHDLSDIVLSYYRDLASRAKGKISLLAVGSEGDKSKMLCENNRWKYIERHNIPVSRKWSSLMQEAKNMDFDFLIIVGSDDLLSLPIIKYYDKVYSGDKDYMLGLRDLYFYMLSSKQSYHFHGYPSLLTIGAGRCFSRKILEKINWKPWHEYSINRGLDSCCSVHLNRCGVQEKAVRMIDTKGVGIDIKHYRTAITEESRVIAKSTISENTLQKYFKKEYDLINNIKCEKKKKEVF